jgi:hypothetical protein
MKKEEIEIVKEFNEKNRYRDGGKINSAIAKVLDYAEKYFDSINTMNCQSEVISNLTNEIKQLSETNKKKDEVIIRLASKV